MVIIDKAPRWGDSHSYFHRLPVTTMPRPRSLFANALVLLLALSPALRADELPDLDPLRFAGEIGAFAEWDAKNTLPEKPISFVGSSSIRMWPTAAAFPDHSVINRGFGGAEFPDIFYYYEQVITR